MEQKFTKGEWKLSNQDTFGRQMVDLGEFKGSVDVWYHHGDSMKKEEAVANARLIASAPNLLKACQNALKDIQKLNKQLIEEGKNEYILMENELNDVINIAVGS